jgi:drug/metabolite transporter (DMT)-like permease
MIWFWVALRVLVNPFSNVFQKVLAAGGMSALAVVTITHGLLSLACLPWMHFGSWPRADEFWTSIVLAAALALVGNALLVIALRMSDLSVLGPVNSYKAVVSLLPGMLLLGEVPSAGALAGMALVVFGSVFLADPSPRSVRLDPAGDIAPACRASAFVCFFTDRGVQYRLAALVLAAIEAAYLKRAVLVSSAQAAFFAWCVLGFFIGLALLAFRGGLVRTATSLAERPGACLALAASVGLMQLSTLIVFRALPVAAALALFQLSTLVSVVLGWRAFGEPHFGRRLGASAVMVAGAVLIVWPSG